MYNLNHKIKFFIITICIVSVFILQFAAASAQYVDTAFSSYVQPDKNNIFQTNYNLDYAPQNVSVERNKVTGNTIDTIHFVNPEEVTNSDYLEVYTVITFCYKDLSQFKDQGFFNNVNLTPQVIEGLPWSYIDLPITKVIDINDNVKALNKSYIDINFDDILQAFYDNFSVTVEDTSNPWSDTFNYGLYAAVEVFKSVNNIASLPSNLYNIYQTILAFPENFNRIQQSVSYMDLCLDLGTDNNLFTYKSNVYYLRYVNKDSVGQNVNDLEYPQTFNLTLPTMIYDSNTLETAGYCNQFLCLINFDITVNEPVFMCIQDGSQLNVGNTAWEGKNSKEPTESKFLRYFYYSTQNLLFYKCSDNSPLSSHEFNIENMKCLSATNIRSLERENFLSSGSLFDIPTYGVERDTYYSTFQIEEILNDNISWRYNYRNRLTGLQFSDIGFKGHFYRYNYNSTTNTETTDTINVDGFYPNAQNYGVCLPIAITNATYPFASDLLQRDSAREWYMYWLCDSDSYVDYIKNGQIATAYCSNVGSITSDTSAYQNLMNYSNGLIDINVSNYSFSRFVSVLKQYDINNYTANNNPTNNYISDPSGATTGSYVTNNNISNEINRQNNKTDTFQVDENSTDCIEWLKAIYYKNVAIDSRLQNFVTLALSWNLSDYLKKFDTYFNDIIFYLKQGFGVDYQQKLNNNLNDLNENYIIENNTTISNLCDNYKDRFPICLLYLPSSILSTFVAEPQKPDFNFNFDIPLNNQESVNVAFGSDVEIVDGATTLDSAFGCDNEEDNWFDTLITLLRISQVIMFAFGLFRLTFKYLKNVDE